MGIRIIATGSYLPEKKLSNSDLEKMVATSDEWIRTRTGIRNRRIAAPEEAASDLGARACRLALERAGRDPGDLDAIITATVSGDQPFPSTACAIQEKIGAAGAFAFDIGAACSGFLYGLAVARGLVASGQARLVMLVAAEVMSRVTDYTDRATCVLLGDGAGAALLESAPEDACLGAFQASDGSLGQLLYLPAGGSRLPASRETVDQRLHYMKMEGPALFRAAVPAMTEAARKALAEAGVDSSDIALVIPHQANMRIIQAVARNLAVPPERLFLNISEYGNMSAASVAVGLDEALTSGRLRPGQLALLFTFGSGLTWAAAVIRI